MTSIRLEHLPTSSAYLFTFGSLRIPMAGSAIFNTREEAEYAADIQGFVLQDDNTVTPK